MDEPVPDTQLEAEEQLPPQDGSSGHEKCVICHEDMIKDGPLQLEALGCGHVMHSGCIDAYCTAAGKQRAESCPYRCHTTINVEE